MVVKFQAIVINKTNRLQDLCIFKIDNNITDCVESFTPFAVQLTIKSVSSSFKEHATIYGMLRKVDVN